MTGVELRKDDLTVYFEGGDAPAAAHFDRILVAVGRRPNSGSINVHSARKAAG